MNFSDFIKNNYNLNKENIKSSVLEYITFLEEDIKYNKDVVKDYGIKTYFKSRDMAKLTKYSTNNNNIGPIMFIRGVLDNKRVYLIVLGGTEKVPNQATGLKTDILSALELNNAYLNSVYNAILDFIPLHSSILIVGSSLGGMIAQQVVAEEGVKKFYNIINVLTFGSPIVCPTKRDCNVIRLCDSKDIVPLLSLSSFSDNFKEYDLKEKFIEDGGYTNFLEAHKKSYCDNSVWDDYDCLGIKYGNSSITLNMNNIKYFDALNF